MIVRNKNGQLINIDLNKKNSDSELYKDLWKLKYNIKLKSKNYGHNNRLISYVRNDKNLV